MSEETTTVSATTIPNIDITRSEVTLSYQETELMRGDNKGWKYPNITITADNLQDVIKHIGTEIIVDKLSAMMRVASQNWWEEATKASTDKETGKLNLDQAIAAFSKLATDFSARGDSIPELKKQIEELVNQITSADPTAEGFKAKVTDLSSKIKGLQAVILTKKRDAADKKPKTDADGETDDAS